jgi:uncharacterized protein (DUF2267 family)
MTTGLPVFDTTVQQSNRWLGRVQAMLPDTSRQDAYAALRAVLHALRDGLPMAAVLGLSAQMPMLLRGVLLEGWRPFPALVEPPTLTAFRDAVAKQLPPTFGRSPEAVMTAVFAVLADRLDPGEADKIIRLLPEPLRDFWPADYVV